MPSPGSMKRRLGNVDSPFADPMQKMARKSATLESVEGNSTLEGAEQVTETEVQEAEAPKTIA
jgi:hypothetical protein